MKIIAEIGSVHNGSLQFAKSLIKYAANIIRQNCLWRRGNKCGY